MDQAYSWAELEQLYQLQQSCVGLPGSTRATYRLDLGKPGLTQHFPMQPFPEGFTK